jgi:membrane fusion protein, macrolide-specific efflux system
MKILFRSALKKNISFLLMVIAFLSLGWPSWPHQALAETPAAAPSQSEPGDILLIGKLACSLKQAVSMPFFGVITALPVQTGQRISKGETLARYRLLPESVAGIRSRLFPTAIKDLELTRVKLTARLNELEKKRAGLQQLAKQNLTSPLSLNQVENEIQLGHEEMAHLSERLGWARQLRQDDLTLLQKQLGNPANISNIPSEGKLSAPLAGSVVWVNSDLRVGTEMKPGEVAFFIGNLDNMIIKAQVHELEAMRLHLGDQAEVKVVSLPDQKFTARVTRVSWSSLTSPTDQPSFFEVEFSVPNPDHILKDGLKVRLMLPKASRS